jgi:hypothetical protein
VAAKKEKGCKKTTHPGRILGSVPIKTQLRALGELGVRYIRQNLRLVLDTTMENMSLLLPYDN